MSNLPMLVERKDLTIHHKDAAQMVVCLKCRGHGCTYHGEVHGGLWSHGWAVYENWSMRCPSCYGEQFWRAA